MEETDLPGSFTAHRYQVPQLRRSGSLCPRVCKAWLGSGKRGDLGEEGHLPREEVVSAQHHASSHTHIPAPCTHPTPSQHQTCSTTDTAPSMDRTTHIPSHATPPFKTTTSAQLSTDSSVPPGDVVTVSPTLPQPLATSHCRLMRNRISAF